MEALWPWNLHLMVHLPHFLVNPSAFHEVFQQVTWRVFWDWSIFLLILLCLNMEAILEIPYHSLQQNMEFFLPLNVCDMYDKSLTLLKPVKQVEPKFVFLNCSALSTQSLNHVWVQQEHTNIGLLILLGENSSLRHLHLILSNLFPLIFPNVFSFWLTAECQQKCFEFKSWSKSITFLFRFSPKLIWNEHISYCTCWR